MPDGILGLRELRRFSRWTICSWFMLSLLLFVAPDADAQAGSIVLRAGMWLGEELLGYGAGKVFDKMLGLDYEEELRQVEASLSLQLKKERNDKEKIRAELAAAKSQLRILDSLLRSKPTPVDVSQFRRQLAKDLDTVLRVQEEHDERITRLEREVAELTLRLRRLETGPSPAYQEASENPKPRQPKKSGQVALVITLMGQNNTIRINVGSQRGQKLQVVQISAQAQSNEYSLAPSSRASINLLGQRNTIYIDSSLAEQVDVVDSGQLNKVIYN